MTNTDKINAARAAYEAWAQAEDDSADIDTGIETASACRDAFYALGATTAADAFAELVRLYEAEGTDPDGEAAARAHAAALAALVDPADPTFPCFLIEDAPGRQLDVGYWRNRANAERVAAQHGGTVVLITPPENIACEDDETRH